jgi:hypothetical protein
MLLHQGIDPPETHYMVDNRWTEWQSNEGCPRSAFAD